MVTTVGSAVISGATDAHDKKKWCLMNLKLLLTLSLCVFGPLISGP